jgi:hypothetical protein
MSGSMGMGGMGGSMGGMGGGMGMFSTSEHPKKAEDPKTDKPAKGSSNPVVGPTGATPPKGGTAGEGPAQQPGQPAPRRPVKPSAADLNFTMDDLINVITSTIKPTTWDEVGGPGSIAPAAGTLVISQTMAVHMEIERFLEDLRTSSPGTQVVTIRATWLLLDLPQLNQLLSSKGGKEGGIDRKALEAMAAKTKGYLGAVTCFSGQTVHIASGRSRSAVTGAIPVVGGGENDTGYQPIISHPQSGAVLQVAPQLLPNTQAALLDICSSVTRCEGQPEPSPFLSGGPAGSKKDTEGKSPAAQGHTTITLDRVSMVVEQLATTLKVPLGEPTLIGGLTREPSADEHEAADTPQLYLFVEATAK